MAVVVTVVPCGGDCGVVLVVEVMVSMEGDNDYGDCGGWAGAHSDDRDGEDGGGHNDNNNSGSRGHGDGCYNLDLDYSPKAKALKDKLKPVT